MKLVIQIPCYNEELYLAETIDAIPHSFPGIDQVEILVIDDGSTDQTSRVAREHPRRPTVSRLEPHQGLAAAFARGLETACSMGADIIVNTDADNQYCAKDIEKLITPVLDRQADMVIGCRPIEEISYFSPAKKALQRLGSRVVRFITNTQVLDATSGFRAYTRETAKKIFLHTKFTYTLETLVFAGKKNLRVVSVPIRVNPVQLRESRLFSTTFEYLKQSLATLLRLYLFYEPLKSFTYAAAFIATIGFAMLLLAFLSQTLHSAKLFMSSLFFLFLGGSIFSLGILGDINSSQKQLLEEALVRIKNLEDEIKRPPANPPSTNSKKSS
ncbi:MAG: glycosyltransferase family 2 protein [Thermodesulfobacteriota bacterium]